MKQKHHLLLALSLTPCIALLSCGPQNGGDGVDPRQKELPQNEEEVRNFDPDVIYGADNRLDIYELQTDEVKRNADGTVALVKSYRLSSANSGYRLSTSAYSSEMRLCREEPFYEQPTAAFCSGSLVAEDLVMTAGHCITNQSDCNGSSIVFDFQLNSPGRTKTEFAQNDVYQCKSIVTRKLEGSGADYALIRLDRPVEGHSILDVRRDGSIGVGEDIYVIGHPVGLPKKAAFGAKVRSIHSSYLVANLDTYGGNSGSPIFNDLSGEIEGILVRGENDFIWQGSCRVSNRCADNSCRGEDVTLVSELIASIPERISPPEPEPEPQPIGARSFYRSVNKSIPDNNSVGMVDKLSTDEAPMGRKIAVSLQLRHSWKGDLKVVLRAPDGREVLLHNRSGWYNDDIRGIYNETLVADGDLDPLRNVEESGDWQIRVSDHAAYDVGVLESWALHFREENQSMVSTR